MASASSVLRGQLRPGLGRSPPFLVIALLIVISILAFNYWSLSDRYDVLERQLTELQDHIQVITIKKVNAEKQVEALDVRLRETEDDMKKAKTSLEEKTNMLKDLVWQLDSKKESANKLQDKLSDVNALVEKQSVSLKSLQTLENNVEELNNKNSDLVVRNGQLLNRIQELQQDLSAAKREFYIPPVRVQPGSKTGEKEATGNNAANSRAIKHAVLPDGEQKVFNPNPVEVSAATRKNDTDLTQENFGPAELVDESLAYNASIDSVAANSMLPATNTKKTELPTTKLQVYFTEKVDENIPLSP